MSEIPRLAAEDAGQAAGPVVRLHQPGRHVDDHDFINRRAGIVPDVFENDLSAHRPADKRRFGNMKLGEKLLQILGQARKGPVVASGFRLAVAAQIERDHRKMPAQLGNLFPEKKRVGRQSMNQHNRLSAAAFFIIKANPVIRCKKSHGGLLYVLMACFPKIPFSLACERFV